MKNTIWLKIFFLAVLPFLIIYGLLSFIIIQSVFQDKLSQVNMDVKNLAQFNKSNLQGNIENIMLSVRLAAVQMEDIDPSHPDARQLGEKILLAGLGNSAAYNLWLVFDPNAFDGRDAAHKEEYPGEKSGRYIRSYLKTTGSGYMTAPDMEEAVLDDRTESYWYVIPKTTGKPYIAINNQDSYNYGFGPQEISIVTVVYPVFRDGICIGCVGGDFLLDELILGHEIISGTQSALFRIDGFLRYTQDRHFIGKHLKDLGFEDYLAIQTAFNKKEPLSLPDKYSPLVKTRAYNYFLPVTLEDFGETVYVYAAIPESTIMDATYAVLRPIAISLIIALIIFGALLFYLATAISNPIQALTRACEDISLGNLDGEIPVSNSQDEVGVMTRALHRMVEQFRVHLTLQDRSKNLLDIYTRLHTAMYENDQIQDAFDATISVVCGHFKVYKASLVFITAEGTARIVSQYKTGLGAGKADRGQGGREFMYHSQVIALLEDKKYVYLNAFGITGQKIAFLEASSTCLCVLPIMAGKTLRGYILMEGDEATGPLVHDDSALLFISDTISYILTKKEAYAAGRRSAEEEEIRGREEAAEPPEEANSPHGDIYPENRVVQGARGIKELNVDKGLLLIGGAEEQYADLLRISAKVFAEGTRKMRALVGNDIPGFAIEAHGMKGALYNIGADDLGDRAKKLEFAAKGNDAEACLNTYPDFEARLSAFAQKLAVITLEEPREKSAGRIKDLYEALPGAMSACEKFDSLLAIKILAPFRQFSYSQNENIEKSLQKIVDLLENIDYDAALAELNALTASLMNGASDTGGGP
ncbi:MAG: HAMP domain-containing protein [Spirochaetales bacterium]|jgi:HAMP domain-containing protein/HPt (histidine-containing phosphotransfer) domain-containing protein|nr:HAMP domain-containing protein [Spirochaetales bacterium]